MSTSESIPLTTLAEGTGFEGHNAVVSSQVYLLSEAAGVAHHIYYPCNHHQRIERLTRGMTKLKECFY